MANLSSSFSHIKNLTRIFMVVSFITFSANIFAESAQFTRAMDDVEAGDLRKGMRKIYKLAQKADPDAEYQMGVFYDEGIGFRKNPRAAARWYRLAADQGHRDAQYELAVMLDTGMGADKHLVEAFEYYQKAAKQGHPEAKVNLESLQAAIDKATRKINVEESILFDEPKDDADVAAKLQKNREIIEIKREGAWIFVNLFGAAKKEGWIKDEHLTPLADAETQGMDAYKMGKFADAYQIWKPLAAQGHIPTKFRIATMFEQGRGVKKNLTKAFVLYLETAQADHVPAMAALAKFYQHGRVVKKDSIAALRWYRKAANAGNTDAQTALASMFSEGKVVPQNHEASHQFLLSAAKRGEVDAQCRLAQGFATGTGAEKNLINAFAWASLAALQGHKKGKSLLNQIQPKLADWQLAKGKKLTQELFALYVE